MSVVRKVSAVSITLFLMFISYGSPAFAQDPDLPSAIENNETLPSGSLVVPMDHLLQNNNGAFSYFDIRAYGYLNQLLQHGIPLKWVIDTGKTKDGVDFSANASRVRPTAVAATTVNFRGGAFIILPQYSATALQIAAEEDIPAGNNYYSRIHIYKLEQNVTADVRYSLTHIPKISISGDNFAIHQSLLNAAGFVENTHFFQQFASELPGECFTFHSEPHDVPSSAEVEGLIDFVQAGGNALLQCEAVLNYENAVVASASLSGGFQTTAGIVNNELNTSLTFVEPDLAFSQFTGGLAFTGGSVGQWQLDSGNSSVYQNAGHSHAVENSDNSYIQMSQSKINGSGTVGSNIFYLGGHEYANTGLTEVNGQRAYLNAIFVPAAPVNCPELTFNTIYGRVFLDDDFDGTLDNGENGYAGITVEIRDSGNNLVATVITASDGTWVAGVETTGDYTVTVIEPAGSYVTSNNDPQIVSITGAEAQADDVGINSILAVDDSYSTPVNTPLNGNVSTNDTYEAGSTFSLDTSPTNGSITFNSDGTFTYTPNNGYNGIETFTYEVCAPSPNTTACDIAEVTITIADLTIVKSNSPDSNTRVVAGDIITYTTIVTATGSAALTNVDLVDAVPDGTTYVPGSVNSTITHPTLSLGNPALTSQVFTSSGSWVAPAGVTQVIVEAWGGGGASRNGTDRRGGAGGAGYARSVLPVTGGTSYTVTVGSGGTTSQQAGGDSWFNTNTTIFAEGGDGGSDGIVLGGDQNIGDVTFNGGSGGARGTTAGGGGGGSATATAAGGNGAAGSGGIGGAGGTGEGDGGDGGDTGQPGQNGSFPGGGAGGSGNGLESVNTGGNGQVIIYYIQPGTTGDPDAIASNWTLGPNSILEVSFQVEVSDPLTVAVITNTSSVSSNELPSENSNEVQNIVQPVAENDNYTTQANTPLDGDVSDNDTAPPGSTYTKLTDPSNGSVTFNSDGTFTYTPDPGFNGTDTFTYQVCNPAPNGDVCDDATVTVSIADLTIVKSNLPDESTFVQPGETITYTLTLENTGSTLLTNVGIEDILPLGTTYVSNSVSSTITGNEVTEVFNVPGAQTWTAPSGVTSITVEVWGAGGSTKNGNDSRGGAGGGAYARSTLSVTPGQTYNLFVGDGPITSEQDGEDSWFGSNSTVLAEGGRKGGDGIAAGGLASNSIGDVTFNGGSGGARSANKDFGGGGGGSGTSAGAGGNGTSATDTAAGTGGAGTGNGGNGGANLNAGQDGQQPGGGGGGSGGDLDNVSEGGDGQVSITYQGQGTVSAPSTLASNWQLDPGAVLEISFDVTVDDPVTQFVFLNSATVSSTELPDITSNEVRNQTSSFQVTGGPCWRTLSSPVQGATYGDMLSGIWTQGVAGSDFADASDANVLIWDFDATPSDVDGSGGDALGAWAPPASMSNTATAGTGFLVSVFADDNYDGTDDPFPKTLSFDGTPYVADVSPTLPTGADEWFLAGNPFQTPIDFDLVTKGGLTNVAYVYDRNSGSTTTSQDNTTLSGSWVSTDGTIGDIQNGWIASYQGFFVQNSSASETRTLTFTDGAKILNDVAFLGKENREEIYAIRLEVEGEELRNSAWLRFSEYGVNNQLVPGDAVELASFGDEYAQLATRKGQELLDIGQYSTNYSQDLKIPVHVESTRPGDYTLRTTQLNLPIDLDLELYDTQTGRIVPLKSDFEYTFRIQSSAGKIAPDLGMECGLPQQQLIKKLQLNKAAGDHSERFIIQVAGSGSNETELPNEVALNQNYPNPFNPSTVITYAVPMQSDVLLEVFDMTGRQITTLVNQNMAPGRYNVNFDGTGLSSGVYIYRLQTGAVVLTKKLTLVK